MPDFQFLFLDRDGVINDRLPGRYVQKIQEFQFAKGALEAFPIFKTHFQKNIVVTNQQGIGKGLMTTADLSAVHGFMEKKIEASGGRLDAIYHCPNLRGAENSCRKPKPGMAFWAKKDFPELDFSKSIMVGDSLSDMLFGKRLGMKTILITSNPDQVKKSSILNVDEYFSSLLDFAKSLPPI